MSLLTRLFSLQTLQEMFRLRHWSDHISSASRLTMRWRAPCRTARSNAPCKSRFHLPVCHLSHSRCWHWHHQFFALFRRRSIDDARDAPAILGFDANLAPHRGYSCGIDLPGPPGGLDVDDSDEVNCPRVGALAGPVLSAWRSLRRPTLRSSRDQRASLARSRISCAVIRVPGPLWWLETEGTATGAKSLLSRVYTSLIYRETTQRLAAALAATDWAIL